MKNKWKWAFALAASLNVLAAATGWQALAWVTKPLMMPFLALWLWQETRLRMDTLHRGWLIGLAFSTLGDILLMFSGSMFFILGLSAFLLAHVSYIGAITTATRGRRGFLSRRPWWNLLFVLYPLALLGWLWPDIPAGMRIPVALYALVIATMAQRVFNLRDMLETSVFSRMMTGAILFILSDSLIAVNKFGHPFPGAPVAVIATYIAGQYLLASAVHQVVIKGQSATS